VFEGLVLLPPVLGGDASGLYHVFIPPVRPVGEPSSE
jgi:hypothetical protein